MKNSQAVEQNQPSMPRVQGLDLGKDTFANDQGWHDWIKWRLDTYAARYHWSADIRTQMLSVAYSELFTEIADAVPRLRAMGKGDADIESNIKSCLSLRLSSTDRYVVKTQRDAEGELVLSLNQEVDHDGTTLAEAVADGSITLANTWDTDRLETSPDDDPLYAYPASRGKLRCPFGDAEGLPSWRAPNRGRQPRDPREPIEVIRSGDTLICRHGVTIIGGGDSTGGIWTCPTCARRPRKLRKAALISAVRATVEAA